MRCQPVYFGPATRPLFGWLHGHAGVSRGTGLVLCNPFGYESLCAHRTLRRLAETASAAGIPTLRFDYDGCGDSAGSDMDPRRLEAWVASVRAAAEMLRAATAVQRVCVFGLRLGAAVATLAGLEYAGIDALVASAAVVNGRGHVRELRALQSAMDVRRGRERPPNEAYIESGGYVLTAETQGSLANVNLLKLGKPAPRVLLLDRADVPGNDAWAARLREAGAEVETATFAGYAEMMLDIHESLVPQQLLDLTVQWVAALEGKPVIAAVTTASPAPPARQACFAAASDEDGAEVRETPVRIDDCDTAFGIVSAPAQGGSSKVGLLVMNSGGVHHVGPGRMSVRLARSWSRRGHVVLRLDQSGIGDSAPEPGQPDNLVYSPFGTRDVRRAVDYLRKEHGVTQVHALGICSGAYHSYKAAVAGVALTSVVLINPLTFFWHEGISLAFPEYRVAADMKRYRNNMWRAESWAKLLKGGVNLPELAGVLLRRAQARASTPLRSCARALRLPLRHDLHAELRGVAAAGVQLHFVFADNEPGIELLRDQGGRLARRLQANGKLDIRMIPGADHTFTDAEARERLFAALTELVDASAASEPAAQLPPTG